MDDWDRYADLLHPLSSSENPGASHVRADGGGTWDAAEQATYLLSQSEELQESLQALQKIEALVDQRKVLDADKSRALSRKFPSSPHVVREKDMLTRSVMIQAQ